MRSAMIILRLAISIKLYFLLYIWNKDEIAYSDACYLVYNHGLYFLVEENFMLLVIRRFMCQQSNGYFQLVENYHAISSIV